LQAVSASISATAIKLKSDFFGIEDPPLCETQMSMPTGGDSGTSLVGGTTDI
jgi:hypothetical protein